MADDSPADSGANPGKDYRATVFLPDTPFAMRGDLPKREPAMLARWARIGLWQHQRNVSKGRPKFILHDGPPYANGNLHIGHALNKILKDIINRAQQMSGKDAVYVPGWDCHGLPIEWKIEEEYRAKKKSKDAVPVVEFRNECREFARHWIGVQRAEFERLGVIGDWMHPYTTMEFAAEAQIAREIGKFLMNGLLYRGSKPVMWSVVEQTALAEAEIEYHDHTSTQVWVRFPVVKPGHREIKNASIVIWTTTPWTLPGNRAIAYGADTAYLVLRVREVAGGSPLKPGEHIVVAETRWPELETTLGFKADMLMALKGAELAGTVCRHPLHGRGYDFDVPLLPGDFVTDTDGTGFVHIAPGHGADDFDLGRKHGIAVPETVAADGSYVASLPLFAGKRVFKPNGKEGDANGAVMAALKDAGALLGEAKLVHSYPHSWRSKAPLIFRTTPQWFIGMDIKGADGRTLRETALAAIDATRWIPEQGRNRIRAMIETRPDWCISRQRAWGVPIAVFVDKKTGVPLRDHVVIDRIAAVFEKEGSDAWFTRNPAEFLGSGRNPADYEQVKDIVDVWFDSGSTHAFVLEPRKDKDLAWPASLYLEGSDQHRGWFHSSLLESCGTRGRAPYEAVLTHGFVLDEQGRKMSKSLGNVTSPQDVVAKSGADILRLWVVAADYADDLRIGPEILKQQSEIYRRLRNTLRYLLGALNGFAERERVAEAQMPELERWVLYRLHALDGIVRSCIDAYDFHTMFTELHNFCAVDLSAFYFDVRKDSLYCDPPGDLRRRAVRTVLDRVFDALVRWLAPVLCFTAEEAWLCRHGDGDDSSIHYQPYPQIPATWRDEALGLKWTRIRDVRRVVTGAIELKRAEKFLGSSLQAAVLIYANDEARTAFAGVDAAELCITSAAAFAVGTPPAGAFTLPDVPGVAVVVERAPGDKCARCWRVLPEVGDDSRHTDLCRRCADAVGARGEAA
ncbi:MAG: isoleucine--tRNA ligase [Alphaproteobacteria bacterium]|nr:isoleucine--tRNA ligase [Alphaproteobacteria bacterium]